MSQKHSMLLCKQKDSMQCGIACLQMICYHHGKKYSVNSLSNFCFTTHEGITLLTLSEAAKK